MKDAISTRMKEFYENRTKTKLIRRTYTIIRIDGKAFHTYTRGMDKPFDKYLIKDMNDTAIYLCKNIQGAKIGYVQSDEISILLTDFDNLNTDMWFDGDVQKIVSIAASMATAKFNQIRSTREITTAIESIANGGSSFSMNNSIAEFDARVFQIPYQEEVLNYFIWRQQDAVRNSISSVAQSMYSASELYKKNTNAMQDMIFQKGVNWNDFSPREKRGSVIRKNINDKDKTIWSADDNTPIFTTDKDYLRNLFPNNSL